jgi:ribosomal protein L11 methyltransferase
MPLREVRVEIDRAALDAVEAVLAEVAVAGWSLYEDVIGGRAWLIGVFSDEAEARLRWAEMHSRVAPRVVGSPRERVLADEDWRESYKAHFKAWRCGRLHWVPEWERATHRLPRGHTAVHLDPGLAFGTGNHETTRLCCHRLVDFAATLSPRARRTWRVIDAGCGSGILAISAARLGCRRIFAFDHDAEAVAVARENARRNRVTSVVRFASGGVGDLLAHRQAELVLANIQADVLTAHARVLLGAVAPRGSLVLSGILANEAETMRRSFRRIAGAGWKIRSRKLGDWVDFALSR